MALPGAGVCLVLSWTLTLPLMLQLQLTLPGLLPPPAYSWVALPSSSPIPPALECWQSAACFGSTRGRTGAQSAFVKHCTDWSAILQRHSDIERKYSG